MLETNGAKSGVELYDRSNRLAIEPVVARRAGR
jgi:hypothetical protein